MHYKHSQYPFWYWLQNSRFHLQLLLAFVWPNIWWPYIYIYIYILFNSSYEQFLNFVVKTRNCWDLLWMFDLKCQILLAPVNYCTVSLPNVYGFCSFHFLLVFVMKHGCRSLCDCRRVLSTGVMLWSWLLGAYLLFQLLAFGDTGTRIR